MVTLLRIGHPLKKWISEQFFTIGKLGYIWETESHKRNWVTLIKRSDT